MIDLLLVLALLVVPAGIGAWGLRMQYARGGILAHRGAGSGIWFACAAAVGALVGLFLLDLEESDEVVAIGGLCAGLVVGFLLLGWDEVLDHLAPSFYACVRREVRGLFTTPIPYFVLFLFLLVSGWVFWWGLVKTELVGFRVVFGNLADLGFFLFPLLTMGCFARERSEGTIEVLMTAPVSERSVTVAKFVGLMVFYLAMLLPTVGYYAVLREIGREIGKPDPGPVVSAYLGMVLVGGFFVSLGIFASSLTRSHILAAILTWVLMLVFWLSEGMSTILGLSGSWPGDVLEYIDPVGLHLPPFLGGIVDPRDVIFYLSFTVFFLFLAARGVEARKGR